MAEHARVSRQTVSNVLNSPEIVRPETRERVLRAIEELGYRPNVVARQLRTRRSSVLGLRMPPASDGISGQVLDRFLHALTDEAQRAGLRVMLFTAEDDDAEIREYQTLRATTGIDGFVLANTHAGDPRTQWLCDHDVPFVTVGRPWDDGGAPGASTSDDGLPHKVDDHPWVDIDGRAGTRAATQHLLDAGHRRVAFLGWPEGSGVGDDRLAGWLETLTDAGLAGDAVVQRTEDSVAMGAAAANRVLRDDDVTALVCVSDSIALGALAAARELAASRPDRAPVAITGFDDTPVARAVDLTSVAQPVADVAARAIELLRGQLDARPDSPDASTGVAQDRQVLIEPHLVVRATSRAAR
ncbi:LacI family DNA-binding transcriptional regulator [Isoptericola variabilis]|uniref:LacI family DNA-binding transcriptional regulator n=1 Tax=Isoptericola variabilis TaxID=139208 RepID=UPI001E5CC9C1|nr:LacI family DNA-binding transcriptional regulator [Isoptericola variabilis]